MSRKTAKPFTVHSRSAKRFETEAEARAYAERYFQQTGNIVAITKAEG